MELKRVEANNFGLFEHFDIALDDCGLVCITGVNKDSDAASSNGSGKSTIVKALAWGLYGESIDGADGDAVIRSGTAAASVVISALDSGKSVIIKRSRAKGKPAVQLDVDGVAWSGSRGDIQARIDSVMGMDFATFRNTVMYGQGDRKRFIGQTATDAERKALLSSILKLDALPACLEVARSEAADCKEKLAANALKAKLVAEEISKKDTSSIESQSSEWERTRTARALKFRNQAKAELEASAVEKAEYQERIDVLAEQIKEAPNEARVAELKALLTKVSRAVDDATAEANVLSSECRVISNRIGDISEQLSNLKEDVCPVCTSDLASGKGFTHKQSLLAKQAALLKSLEERQAHKVKANTRAADLRAELETAREAFVSEQGKYAAAGTKIKLLGDLERDMSNSVLKRREAAKVWVNASKAVLSEKNPFSVALETVELELKELKAKQLLLNEEALQLAEKSALVQFWVKGFSNQGITSFMLDSAMPYLTERANHYLGILADGDITMCFSTQRELSSKKGAMRDEISISWRIEGVEAYPPSGGQLKKIEIATDLALMDLVATRDGKHPGILILDEILDGLDAEGKHRVTLLLHELRKVRGSIFVISHDDGISESFDQTIRVTKSGGVSSIDIFR